MRQRLDNRRMDREHGIEEMREPDAMRFGDQAEQVPVAVEAPGPSLRCDFDARFIVPVQQFVRDLSARILVSELKGLRSEPLSINNSDETIGQNALYRRIG